AARLATGSLVPSPGIHDSVRQFYQSLAAKTSPPVTPEEGRRIVYWAEKAAFPADADKYRRLHPPDKLEEYPVLVTGATGFLGKHLVRRLLADGERVRLLVRRRADAEFAGDPRVSLIYGDLGDPEAVDRAVCGASLVYHLG